jgi:hypothetical protein
MKSIINCIQCKMKLAYTILLVTIFTGCGFDNVTRVQVTNNNNYPISIYVQANNVHTTIAVPAMQKVEQQLIFTNIEKVDGSYTTLVTHNNQGTDSFNHGYFTNGELANYLELIVNGHEVKARASN